MAVDTLGLLWAVVVTPASVQDRDGGVTLLTKLRGAVKRLNIRPGDRLEGARMPSSKP